MGNQGGEIRGVANGKATCNASPLVFIKSKNLKVFISTQSLIMVECAEIQMTDMTGTFIFHVFNQ